MEPIYDLVFDKLCINLDLQIMIFLTCDILHIHSIILVCGFERYNNVKYKNFPYYKGSLIWEGLPNEVKRSENLIEFMKALSRIYTRYDPLVV